MAVKGVEADRATPWQVLIGVPASEKPTVPPGVTGEVTVAVKVTGLPMATEELDAFNVVNAAAGATMIERAWVAVAGVVSESVTTTVKG